MFKVYKGKYEYFLDDKGRTRIPPTFKELLGDKLYIGYGEGRYLVIYTDEELESLAQKAKEIPDSDRLNKMYYREIFNGIMDLTADSQKRYRIPKEYVDFAQLSDTIVFAGSFTRVELWSKENYERRMDDDIAYYNINRLTNNRKSSGE